MLRWSRRLCTRGASRGNRLSVLPASIVILPFTGGNYAFDFAGKSRFDDNGRYSWSCWCFVGGIVGIDFFLILSTGHGAYLTGRSAAQLMIRLTTISLIVIIVDHHSHQNHNRHRLHCDLYHCFLIGFTKLWLLCRTVKDNSNYGSETTYNLQDASVSDLSAWLQEVLSYQAAPQVLLMLFDYPCNPFKHILTGISVISLS